MGNEHNALLEAMEQQSISIAKAGIVCTLSARASGMNVIRVAHYFLQPTQSFLFWMDHYLVIAAANPAGGHYNRAKTVAENLKISAPLLSRFDIIFILLDTPDEARDQVLGALATLQGLVSNLRGCFR